MITYSKIGKKGNLGNQFFQIAATIGLATKNKLEVGFLPWQYQEYFKNKLPILYDLPNEISILNEKHYHYHSWEFKTQITNYDLAGWLQSEKYFDIPKARFYFEFQDSLVSKIKAKYEKAFERKTILISIRRGDFVGHADYQQLSIKYYFSALIRFFPDWESTSLVVLSDDIAYCKFHFAFLENVFFGDGLNAVEQLCLGSLCDDFIISNSTFSWWSAWLGEKSESKIIRPHKNFDGIKSLECDDKDYFPERWISYHATADLIPLKEVIIHLNFENNFEPLKVYLQHYFDVEIRNNSISNDDCKFSYFFNKDYFLPPFLIYYTYLRKKNSMESIVIDNTFSIFKVSKKWNYDEFIIQQDFGMFSSIFDFKVINQKKANKIIYIENAAVLKIGNIGEQESTEIVINAPVGKFCNSGGYIFSAKRFLKNSEIALKGNIKKLLRIKKK